VAIFLTKLNFKIVCISLRCNMSLCNPLFLNPFILAYFILYSTFMLAIHSWLFPRVYLLFQVIILCTHTLLLPSHSILIYHSSVIIDHLQSLIYNILNAWNRRLWYFTECCCNYDSFMLVLKYTKMYRLKVHKNLLGPTLHHQFF
jgi:hypothetical protein